MPFILGEFLDDLCHAQSGFGQDLLAVGLHVGLQVLLYALRFLLQPGPLRPHSDIGLRRQLAGTLLQPLRDLRHLFLRLPQRRPRARFVAGFHFALAFLMSAVSNTAFLQADRCNLGLRK